MFWGYFRDVKKVNIDIGSNILKQSVSAVKPTFSTRTAIPRWLKENTDRALSEFHGPEAVGLIF